jgi:hypothetical protein
METYKLKEILQLATYILLVVGLGLIILNQFLAYHYKALLLQKPCELCAELNKPQASCVQQCFTYQVGKKEELKEIILENFTINFSTT